MLLYSSCATNQLIDDALATGNPADPEAAVASPPVAPAALRIAPTGLSASQVPAVGPQPVESRMDDAFHHRRVPQRPEAAPRHDPADGRAR